MLYVDTSVIVTLYIKEQHSRDVSNWLKTNDEAIPLSNLHELEFINAIQLKLFRNEAAPQESRQVIARFKSHERKGIYYRPSLDWPTVFIHAIELSKNHTSGLGSRSLDILHVASALSMSADRFLTLDDRQAKLAAGAGLEVLDNFQKPRKTPA